ncbi:hypothetical protein [Nocardioides jejuensis]|uniref:FlgD Ig-like domain-containing protein n=1 Tax=Nocardioides jejuensis TaxID=2502782 RepID=A0A4R1C0Y6_9ACTN|nr:hypothetical protein [Nocardioides jejuensis]TCJ24143.1 hypothetical protein EPD65_09585 [Nocardioides jejuensis]
MRRHLLAAALIAGSVTVLAGTPAYAAPAAPVLSDLDTSVAGHVTGTVTGGPDAQSAWVCWSGCHINTGLTGAWWIPLDPSTHAATFDLPTWGYRDGAVSTVVCATAPSPGSNCSSGNASPAVYSDTLTATDVVPTITWPADTTIGTNPDGTTQQVSATLSDTGGGKLTVDWTYSEPDAGDHDLLTPVAHNGTTQLNLADGVGHLRLFRCNDYNSDPCTHYDVDSAQTTVDRESETLYLSSPAITSAVDPSHGSLPTNHQGAFQASWHVSADGQEIAGSTGAASGTIADDGSAAIDIPGAGLPEGYDLRVDGTISIDDPDFGPTTRPFTGSLTVDREGPAIEGLTVSRTSIHPTAIDALASFRTTTIAVHDDTQLDYQDKIAIHNASGVQVRVLEPEVDSWFDEHVVWDGRDEAGDVVPVGTYTVTSVDPLGNPSGLSRTVAVWHSNGILKTFTKKVTPAAAKVATVRGRCATLASPASRGWTGSIGYYANARCRSTSNGDDVASTVSAVTLPTAVRYRDLHVDTYGGASLKYRASAVIGYWNDAAGEWKAMHQIGGTVATHAGITVTATPYVDGHRTVHWLLGTAKFNRYDVKTFTVTARYYAWS